MQAASLAPPLPLTSRLRPARASPVLTKVRNDAQEKYNDIPPSHRNSSEAQELERNIRIANATLLGVGRLDGHIETLLDCKFFRKAFRGLQDVLCDETYKTMVRSRPSFCAACSELTVLVGTPQVYISVACILAVVGLAISAVTMNFTITSIKKAVSARRAAQELELS